MHASLPEVDRARHGETPWTLSGQHTGRTDILLTPRGEQNAVSLRQRLNGVTFAKVLVSPLSRACPPLQSRPFSTGPDGALAGTTGWRCPLLRVLHGGVKYPRLRTSPGGTGHPPVERRLARGLGVHGMK